MPLVWEQIETVTPPYDIPASSALSALFTKNSQIDQVLSQAGSFTTLRAKVAGGWFVKAGKSAFFYPDPEHAWDGNSLR